MKFTFKNIWSVLKQTFSDFSNLAITRMAAALSYYTVFSLTPMLLVIITVLGFFFGRDAIEGRIYDQIKLFVGSEPAAQIQQLIKNEAVSPGITLTSIIGVAALIVSATG